MKTNENFHDLESYRTLGHENNNNYMIIIIIISIFVKRHRVVNNFKGALFSVLSAAEFRNQVQVNGNGSCHGNYLCG